jgi:hypothetical protein
MLKLGQEIGISPIKCENKEGTEALKTLHFKINDVLYAHTYRYIFPATAARLLDSLTSLGVELKDLQVPDKAAPKKEEILVALRAICRSLKECIHTPITEEDHEAMQKAINGQVHRCIKAKPTLTPEKTLGLLLENKQLASDAARYWQSLKTTSFVKMQEELIQILTKEISLSE